MTTENKPLPPATPAQVRAQADRPQRKGRIPFGVARSKLSVAMTIEGYHLHWVNDTPGRISEAERGGYMFVEPSEVGESGGESRVKRLVGTNEDGSALYSYLMKIEQDFYDADQKVIQDEVDKFDSAIRKGDLDKKPGDNRYNGGIKITGGR